MKVRSRRGFALPELMLAAAIAAFAVCGLLLMYVTAMDLIRTSKNASIATRYAQDKIEAIRNTPFRNIITTYNGQAFSVNGIPAVNGVASSGLVSVNNADPDLLLVTVNVRWRQSNRNIDSTVELTTKVASR